jgi:hypothetical protein
MVAPAAAAGIHWAAVTEDGWVDDVPAVNWSASVEQAEWIAERLAPVGTGLVTSVVPRLRGLRRLGRSHDGQPADGDHRDEPTTTRHPGSPHNSREISACDSTLTLVAGGRGDGGGGGLA